MARARAAALSASSSSLTRDHDNADLGDTDADDSSSETALRRRATAQVEAAHTEAVQRLHCLVAINAADLKLLAHHQPFAFDAQRAAPLPSTADVWASVVAARGDHRAGGAHAASAADDDAVRLPPPAIQRGRSSVGGDLPHAAGALSNQTVSTNSNSGSVGTIPPAAGIMQRGRSLIGAELATSSSSAAASARPATAAAARAPSLRNLTLTVPVSQTNQQQHHQHQPHPQQQPHTLTSPRVARTVASAALSSSPAPLAPHRPAASAVTRPASARPAGLFSPASAKR